MRSCYGRTPVRHLELRTATHDDTRLRRGACASVALVADMRTGRRVAIKFIPRASCSGPSGLVLRELQNHKACHGHPHIVELVVRAVLDTLWHSSLNGPTCAWTSFRACNPTPK